MQLEDLGVFQFVSGVNYSDLYVLASNIFSRKVYGARLLASAA